MRPARASPSRVPPPTSARHPGAAGGGAPSDRRRRGNPFAEVHRSRL